MALTLATGAVNVSRVRTLVFKVTNTQRFIRNILSSQYPGWHWYCTLQTIPDVQYTLLAHGNPLDPVLDWYWYLSQNPIHCFFCLESVWLLPAKSLCSKNLLAVIPFEVHHDPFFLFTSHVEAANKTCLVFSFLRARVPLGPVTYWITAGKRNGSAQKDFKNADSLEMISNLPLLCWHLSGRTGMLHAILF